MISKTQYQRICITDCSEANASFVALFRIFSATLKPDMDFRHFRAYYWSSQLKYIDVTFILENNLIVGFCAAAFYGSTIDGKSYIIGRAATGILPQHRGRKLPKWKLYKKYIQFRIKNPFTKIILSAYVANPLVYAMICKYTAVSFPRPYSEAPPDILKLKDALIRSQKLRLANDRLFVVQIHFCVAIDAKDRQRIFTSKDGAVQYFLDINPGFLQQYGVLVIIPVTPGNILVTILKFIYYAIMKIPASLIRRGDKRI